MIEFKEVFYKNFMSVGNQGLRVVLDRSPTTLVGGKNGAGKSTLLEAITYCLFGKPLKKIVLSGLINSINKKGMEVEVKFDSKGKSYRVVRGQKPNKLELYIDGQLLDQTANAKDYQAKIEYILGMDYKLFTQVTILNKERYVPFMEMGAGERRKVVEDILDISIFSSMSDLLKEEIKGISNQIEDLKYERDGLTNKIAAQQRLIDEAQSNVDGRRAEVQADIDDLDNQLAVIESRIDSVNAELSERCTVGEELTKAKARKAEFEKIGMTFGTKLKHLNERIDFLCKNDNCPTCLQPMDKGFVEKVREENTVEIDKIKKNAGLLAVELKKVIETNSSLEDAHKALQELHMEARGLTGSKKLLDSTIASKKALLGTLVYNTKLDDYRDEKSRYEDLFLEVSENLQAKITDDELLKVARDYLKDDGIKASIVKDYIGFINIRLNEYLNSMNFFLNITLNENFEEKINSINRENFTIDNLSTGQKCRVNLAVWMSLLEVSSLKNSAVTNLICLDEVLENLDANGVEDFMKLAKDKLAHKNLFVITQRFEEFKDHFRSHLEFTLSDGFTEIVR